MNAALLEAVKNGTVKESTIDDKVMRISGLNCAMGSQIGRSLTVGLDLLGCRSRGCAGGALESITLLKNEGHILPLDAGRVKTIAVVGPNAWPAVPGGGGSSEAQAFEPVAMLTGIANLVGPNVHVLYSRGLPEMNEVFWRTRWEGGVKVATYPSKDFTGTPETAGSGNIANYKEEWWGPADKTPRSIRYSVPVQGGQRGQVPGFGRGIGERPVHGEC